MELSKNPKSLLFCGLCRRYLKGDPESQARHAPCSEMHKGAIKEALKQGGAYIYTCPMGFYFWTSPFFSMERFAGAIVSGGAPALEKRKIADRMHELYLGKVSREEIAEYLDGIPQRNFSEIEALAQMQLLCASHVSRRAGLAEGRSDSVVGGAARAPAAEESLDAARAAEKERLLLANLRRGDSAEAQTIARELLQDMRKSLGEEDCIEPLKLRAMEMVILLSRAGANAEKSDALVETSSQHLKRIKDSKCSQELIRNVDAAVQRMAGKIFSFQGVRHASALRKAERFIWDNYTRKVSLKEIARVSGLSPPYFSTIFKAEMGENLSDYINRLRVGRASAMLRDTDMMISQISQACGFEDQSWFSKIFKNHTGASPCKYRRTVGSPPLDQSFKERKVKQI